MKTKKIVAMGSALAVGTLAGLAQDAAAEKAAPAAEIGKAAPAFELADLAGAKHSLEAYKGSYIVLEWTNLDCPFVKKYTETGRMSNLQKRLGDEGVIWLTIGSSKPGAQGNFSKEQWEERLKEVKAAAKAVLPDPTGTVGRLYGASNTPHMFVIDPAGVLIYAGAIDNQPGVDRQIMDQAVNYVVQALDEAKAGKPVSTPQTKAYGCSVKY